MADLTTYEMLRVIADLETEVVTREVRPDVPERLPHLSRKVVERKLHELADRGLITYVLITRPWLTVTGRRVLEALETAAS